MSRTTTQRSEALSLLNTLWSGKGEVLDLDHQVNLLQSLRQDSPNMVSQIDHALLTRMRELRQGLTKAQTIQKELKSIIDTYRNSAWVPGVFIRKISSIRGTRALVVTNGNVWRVVDVDMNVSVDSLATGDEVFLTTDLNVIMEKAAYGASHWGEIGSFDRRLGENRIVLKVRDEEVVVEVAAALQDSQLEPGDQLRWHRNVFMAYEKLEREAGQQFLLKDVEAVGLNQIGGHDRNLATLLNALTLALANPAAAKRYGLSPKRSVLLVGPPGCGKTTMVRVAVSEIQRRLGQCCQFGAVKPAEWESPWVGETQRNIRDCFSALRRAAGSGMAVLFLDEIEAVGRIRGGATNLHSDKFLASLLAELDGFSDRQGIAIVAATNRTDLVDPALLERLSDVEIQVNRPNAESARKIFHVHLPSYLPFDSAEGKDSDTYQDFIEAAVSRLFSPNGANEICSLKLRDGKTRTVKVRELMSGRIIRQICDRVKDYACLREAYGDDSGICLFDIEEAIADVMERLTKTLTRHNIHSYLDDLPQDVDVMSVDPIHHRLERPHRYFVGLHHTNAPRSSFHEIE